MKRKTPKQYLKECEDKGLDLPIEDYQTNKIKIKHKCKKGHVYYQTPSHHLKGQSCPYCKNTKQKKTPKQYIQKCKDKGYDLPIEDYINNSTKIKHKCDKGHIYKQVPKFHLRGDGCPYCNGGINKTSKQYIQECKDKDLDLPIEDYVNATTKIKHKCKQGHIYLQLPSNHLNGHCCPICKDTKKTTKQYIQECKDKEYDLPIEDYKNATTKIKYKCNKGHIYNQRPYHHLEGYGCPICNESKGERYIRNYLNKNNIKYESQKTFSNLKDRTYLSYDFYLPEYNMLIEYQGIQHYESVAFNGKDKTDLEKQQLHDKLKKEYAEDNGYKLLELHYSLDTQDKVDKYLSRRIKD